MLPKKESMNPTAIDIDELTEDFSDLKFVKVIGKDGQTLEVRVTTPKYVLAKNEKEATQQEYEAQQTKETIKVIQKGYATGAEKLKKTIQQPLPLTNYWDNAKRFYTYQPYFYDKSGTFWFWQEENRSYAEVDDIDVMNAFDQTLGYFGQTVNPKVKANTLEAMKRYGRLNTPKDAKKKWVQFATKAYSIHSGKTHNITHHYFFTNPIPWSMGKTEDTPVMDSLFNEWVGEKYKEDLYEILAYCCYRSYPIQTLFCLYGGGRNGKSSFLRILDRFIGEQNVCSTELDLIAGSRKSQFEVYKLYKKLVCIMGETDFGILSSSSLLKRLTGADKIGFEKKHKDPFDDYSYAKIIIASNSLPSSSDTSDGYYRRWHTIPFSNEFSEGKDVIATIPDEEYNNLARKVMRILPELLKRGEFKNQGSIEDRKRKYMLASNPLPIFLDHCCFKDPEAYMSYNELYTAYVRFLRYHKMRKVGSKEFKSGLEEEGFWAEKTSKPDGFNDAGYPKYKILYWVEGVKLKENWEVLSQQDFADFAHFAHSSTLLLSPRELIYNTSKMGKMGKIDNELIEKKGKQSLLERIKATRNALGRILSPSDISKVISELGLSTAEFDAFLNALKIDGDVFEPRKGFLEVVK